VIDAVAGGVIRGGGMLVIVAVVGILVFLVTTVMPLFRGAELRDLPVAGRVPVSGTLRVLGIDEYRIVGLAVGDDPAVVYFRLDTGEPVARYAVPGLEGARVALAHRTVRSNEAVIATTDGRLAFLDVGFASDFVLDERAPALRASLRPGEQRSMDDGLVRRVAGGNLLRVRPRVGLRGTVALPAGTGPLAAVGYASDADHGAAVAVDDAGRVVLVRESVTKPLVGETTREYALASLAEAGPPVPAPVVAALVDEEVRLAWIVGRDGALLRIDLAADPAVRREIRTTTVEGARAARVTAAGFLIGGRSLVICDDEGDVSVWSPVPAAVPPFAPDGRWLVRRGERLALPSSGAEVAEAFRAGTAPLVWTAASSPDAFTPELLERAQSGADDPDAAALRRSLRKYRPATAAEVEAALEGDGRVTERLHAFPRSSSPVTHVAAGSTRRTVYLSHADGSLTAAYATNERVLGRASAFGGPVVAAAPGSKDDGLLVVGPGLSYKGFEVDAPHPETSFGSLFGRVHYEGYAEPAFLYQSTSGTDEAETKLSLTPLLYGTLKATFYAMLFALPLALLAALYTSQFMHHRVRAFVKPGIEVMASLPSVVLGFLAALVIAPFVEDVVPSVLATLVLVPVAAFLVGVAWHGLPLSWKQGASSATRIGLALVLVAGVGAACLALAGPLQRWFFSGPANPSGDFRVWLRGEPDTGSGLPLLRAALLAVGASLGLFLLPRWGVRVSLPRAPVAVDRAAKALVYAVLPAAALALLAAPLESLAFGGDFRRFLLGADGEVYDQRNSLVVGIAMGFAVIPIVYTIAEDALYAIPDALKSAALACGASPWQTAMRVVVPAAAPGMFSATMIGLGRAVGETMIVLMATGGTPIIDASPFNGFRTLSANIAIELPEAPEGGTLYRVLFLAGLLLFALTFVVNTVAEVIRLRFRKKFKLL
jgi:ABC-type uncharacterized transport system permease subunit